jgi:hypothetical protein
MNPFALLTGVHRRKNGKRMAMNADRTKVLGGYRPSRLTTVKRATLLAGVRKRNKKEKWLER